MAYNATWLEDPSQLNEFEFQKLEKDGLDVIEDVYRYAETGFDSITPDDMARFKWAGIYQQKPKTDPYFMMRVRIPSGILSNDQARALANISQLYGRDLVDVTTRQAVQFHWLQIEDFPDIFARLKAVDLFSFEACGDCPRTIIGNPLAGLDPNELMDTSDLANELNRHFLLNKDFSNLPRKFKISISANIYNAGHAQINDLAFTPAVKTINGEKRIGFHMWVGGGLSTAPHLAQQLDVFVLPEEVLKVAIGVTTIFRDCGYRKNRNRARLKFLIADWGAEKFQEKLFELIGEYPSRGEDKTEGWRAGYFTGVHPQKQEGLNYVGLSLPVGRLTAQELETMADLAEKYGNGSLRTCNTQNIIITNVPDQNVKALLREPLLERLTPNPNTFIGHAVSCTGIEFCNLAVVETKARMQEVAEYLDEHVELDTHIRLHMSGCPNSCGQPQIADIGLQGAVVKTNDGPKDAFMISLGGTLDRDASFNHRNKLKGRVLGEHVGEVVAELVRFYKAERAQDESFHDFFHRVGIAPFQERFKAALEQIEAGAAAS